MPVPFAFDPNHRCRGDEARLLLNSKVSKVFSRHASVKACSVLIGPREDTSWRALVLCDSRSQAFRVVV